MYCEACAHVHVPQRDITQILLGSNRAKDFVTLGAGRLATETKFESWWNDRNFVRATTEIHDI